MYKIAVPFLVLVLLACGKPAPEPVPSNILPKEKFIPLLVDLQILESHFQRQFARVDLYRNALDSSSFYIFEEYGTTKADFVSSLDYYSAEPDTLFLIYEAALDTLNIRLDNSN